MKKKKSALETGSVRVSVRLDLTEYDNLCFCSRSDSIKPTTEAKMLLMKAVSAKCIELKKKGINPDQTTLFNNKKEKRKR